MDEEMVLSEGQGPKRTEGDRKMEGGYGRRERECDGVGGKREGEEGSRVLRLSSLPHCSPRSSSPPCPILRVDLPNSASPLKPPPSFAFCIFIPPLLLYHHAAHPIACCLPHNGAHRIPGIAPRAQTQLHPLNTKGLIAALRSRRRPFLREYPLYPSRHPTYPPTPVRPGRSIPQEPSTALTPVPFTGGSRTL